MAAKSLQRHAVKYASQWNLNKASSVNGGIKLFDFGSFDESNHFTMLHYICKSPSLVLLMDLRQHASADPLAVNDHLLVCHQYIPKIYVTSRKLVFQWEKTSFQSRLAYCAVPPEEVFSEFEKDHESMVRNKSASLEKTKPKIRTHASMKSLTSAINRGNEENTFLDQRGFLDSSQACTKLALRPLDTSSFINFKKTQKRAEYRSIRLKSCNNGTSSIDSLSNTSIKPANILVDGNEERPPHTNPLLKKPSNPGLAMIVATSSRDFYSRQSDKPSIILTRKDDKLVSIEDFECRKSVLLSSMDHSISICFERINTELQRLSYMRNSAM